MRVDEANYRKLSETLYIFVQYNYFCNLQIFAKIGKRLLLYNYNNFMLKHKHLRFPYEMLYMNVNLAYKLNHNEEKKHFYINTNLHTTCPRTQPSSRTFTHQLKCMHELSEKYARK